MNDAVGSSEAVVPVVDLSAEPVDLCHFCQEVPCRCDSTHDPGATPRADSDSDDEAVSAMLSQLEVATPVGADDVEPMGEDDWAAFNQ